MISTLPSSNMYPLYGLLNFYPLLGLALLILWIILPFMVFGLRARVKRLELALAEGRFAPAATAATAPHTRARAHTAEQVEAATTEKPPMPEVAPNAFFAWAKEDWLLKVGGLMLLIGFGWLTTYAFMNNWIGPMGRIGLGILCGTAILVLGTWRIRDFVHQGGIFIIVGSTTILLTVFAAREYYDFFTPLTSLGVMFLSTAYVAIVSVRFRDRTLALASVALAGVAPLLTNSPTTDYVGLYAYLLVVLLGTMWVVSVTNHREVIAAGLILVALYSVPVLLGGASDATLLLFAYAFAAVIFVTNTVGIARIQDRNLTADMITAAGNGLFLLAWILMKAPEQWRSLIIAGWMVIFIVGAYVAFVVAKKREPFYVYAGVAVAMLAAATSAELSGATLTIAFTIEAALLSYISYALMEDRSIAERVSVLFIGPMLLSFDSIDSYAWQSGVLHADFFVLLVLSLSLLGAGYFFWTLLDNGKRTATSTTIFLLVAGSVYAYIVLWLSLRAVLQSPSIAVMISLLIYTVIGLYTYFYGRFNDLKGLGVYGGVLLGFVIARLLLVDVWNMPIANRFVTFFVIGILLMSTAFYGRKKSLPSQS